MPFNINGKKVDLGDLGKAVQKVAKQTVNAEMDAYWERRIKRVKEHPEQFVCPDHGPLKFVRLAAQGKPELGQLLSGRKYWVDTCCQKGNALVEAELRKPY